jgi:hypothetical protein
MMNAYANDMRNELMMEMMSERDKLLNETPDRVDNCSPDMSKSEMLEYRLKSAEIDTKYIAQLLNNLSKASEKTNQDTMIIMILECGMIMLYLMKPVVMYWIQAKYHADKPHDGCRNVLTEKDVIEECEKTEMFADEPDKNKQVNIEFV